MTRLSILAALLVPLLAAGARAAEFQYPFNLVASDDGTIYVADRQLPGIWKIAGGNPEVYFQGSKKFRTPLNAVWSVALDTEGRLLAGDSSTREIYRFNENSEPVGVTMGVDAGIGIPKDLAVNKAGDIFTADQETHRVWKLPADGGERQEVAVLAGARGLFMDARDNLWVISSSKTPLVRVAPGGTIEPVVKDPQAFQMAHDVAVNTDGVAFVSDNYARAVWRVSPDGTVEKWATGEPIVGPVGLAWHGENLVIADPQAKAILSADPSGKVTKLAPTP